MLNVPADPVLAVGRVSKPSHIEGRVKKLNVRQMVMSDGLGTGGGEEAIHM